MLENGFNPDQEIQYALDDSMMVVKVPEYDQKFDVSVSALSTDEIIPGISFANSEVGYLAFCMEAYFSRLVCTNGLIAKTAIAASRFKHISTKALDNFPDTLGQTMPKPPGCLASVKIPRY